MTYYDFAIIHLITVVPVFLLGTYVLLTLKGTRRHKIIGRVYVALLIISCLATFGMPATVGPSLIGDWGALHILSVYVIWALLKSIRAIKKGQSDVHAMHMVGVYIGGLIIAGTLSLMPGRLLHQFFFS